MYLFIYRQTDRTCNCAAGKPFLKQKKKILSIDMCEGLFHFQ